MRQATPEFAARLLERYNNQYLSLFHMEDTLIGALKRKQEAPELIVNIIRSGPMLEYQMPPQNRLNAKTVSLRRYGRELVSNAQEVAQKRGLKLVIEKNTDTHLRFRFVRKQ